jgi:hypothetical protein
MYAVEDVETWVKTHSFRTRCSIVFVHMLEAYLIGNEQRSSTHSEHRRVYYYALHYQLPLSFIDEDFSTHIWYVLGWWGTQSAWYAMVRKVLGTYRASTQNAYITMHYIINCRYHLQTKYFVHMLQTYLVAGVGGGMLSASFTSKRWRRKIKL